MSTLCPQDGATQVFVFVTAALPGSMRGRCARKQILQNTGSSRLIATTLTFSRSSSLDLPSTMAGRLFASYWAKVGPYYTKAYQEMWVGLGIMGYFYYKLSYGGKKAVKDSKPAH
ncbi:hypothetical protein WMY93_015367 [Mugilogobius chulae]|uniref:6.8 kDa mitochondrial proteolipid n=1 Tax=Mugilogobius chulae TaxID=88201 RepID=A0AAW0NQD0_9GOBI